MKHRFHPSLLFCYQAKPDEPPHRLSGFQKLITIKQADKLIAAGFHQAGRKQAARNPVAFLPTPENMCKPVMQ
ncbi:MAG TPA: hypothetical protein VNQ79_22370 [Blastocatellia bacterium]|nr:hypothetical protein [Blastocatellia bacterium]